MRHRGLRYETCVGEGGRAGQLRDKGLDRLGEEGGKYYLVQILSSTERKYLDELIRCSLLYVLLGEERRLEKRGDKELSVF